MLWSFKALATLSLGPSRILHISSSAEEDGSSLTTPKVNAILPESEEHSSTRQSRLCQCGYQQIEFCPYCEHDRDGRLEGFLGTSSTNVDDPDRLEAQLDGLDSSRPRKLRKSRPECQQIYCEVLNVEDVVSARPNSILSTHSRTPLLNTGLHSSPNYLPLPPIRKPNKKLEKKDKRQRSGSMPNDSLAYSSFNDISNGNRHAKIIKSKSFLTSKNNHSHGPRPKPISSSIHTDTLVSLAWTGSSHKPSELVIAGPSSPSHPSNTGSGPFSLSRASSAGELNAGAPESSTFEPFSSKRHSVLRKQKEPELEKRPWTLAMAITDDGITDEKLVNDLEDMRIKEAASPSIIPNLYSLGLPLECDTQLYDSLVEYPPESGEVVQVDQPSPSDASWTAARQALLICRELVRTERRYLASLKTLIMSATSTPPSSLMLSHLPALITSSDALLELMEQNPSVQGVSQAFLSCKDKLSDSFISWCSIVGQFFDSEERGKSNNESEDSPDPSAVKLRPSHSGTMFLSTDTGLSVVVSGPNKIRRNVKARPSIRDLAILPTQRIVHYVLFFKELHSLTPHTLSSFAFIECAVQAAESIALSANQAQGHSAFR